MGGIFCSALVDSFPDLSWFLTLGHLCSLSTTQMIFCIIIICFGICLLISQVLRGAGDRLLLLSLRYSPVDAATSGKGMIRAGVPGSEGPSWVLLAALLPIRVSGHGQGFINSVLLLEFLCCANLLLSDHFQQIYLASHVKLQQTLTN